MPVREIVPELDGEVAKHVNTYKPASRVGFKIIAVVGGERRNLPEPLEQVLLVSPAERPQEIKNLDSHQQSGVAHPG